MTRQATRAWRKARGKMAERRILQMTGCGAGPRGGKSDRRRALPGPGPSGRAAILDNCGGNMRNDRPAAHRYTTTILQRREQTK